MLDEKIRFRKQTAAFATPNIDVPLHATDAVLEGISFVLIFEADEVDLGGAVDIQTLMDGFLVKPALVFGMQVNGFGTTHRVVEVQLLHEAIIWFGEWPALTQQGKGTFWCEPFVKRGSAVT